MKSLSKQNFNRNLSQKARDSPNDEIKDIESRQNIMLPSLILKTSYDSL